MFLAVFGFIPSRFSLLSSYYCFFHKLYASFCFIKNHYKYIIKLKSLDDSLMALCSLWDDLCEKCHVFRNMLWLQYARIKESKYKFVISVTFLCVFTRIFHEKRCGFTLHSSFWAYLTSQWPPMALISATP